MYVSTPSPLTKCAQGPMPLNSGAGETAQHGLIDGWVSGAQGAFNAALARLDLGPNGLPWGTTPWETGQGIPPLNITWPGAGHNPGANGAPFAPGSVGTLAGGTSVAFPRVVDYPHCSPISTAARRAALVEAPAGECGAGVVSGNFVSTFNSAAYPTETQMGGSGPSPSASPCSPGSACAGNAPYYAGIANAMAPAANSNSPYPGQSPSPADRARMGGGIPWWVWVAGAVAVVRFTR